MREYKCLVADPPWEERGGGKSKRGADRHYQLLKIDQIVAVMHSAPIWRPAKDAHLWLWVTDAFLISGMTVVLPALGFRFVRTFVWVKVTKDAPVPEEREPNANLKLGLGQYARGAHEVCLFGVRGNGYRLIQARNVPSVWEGSPTRHSEKPDGFYSERICRVSPGPRAELFARRRRGRFWDAWGDELAADAAE